MLRSVPALDPRMAPAVGPSSVASEVERLGHEAVSVKNQPWLITDSASAQVRALFAQLVRASPDNIALAPSTSYAISQAAHNIARSGRVSAGLRFDLLGVGRGDAMRMKHGESIF